MQGTYTPEMEEVPVTVDSRYLTNRFSPSDLLWPLSFKGSDFDDAPWIGRTGRKAWINAQSEFGLTDDQKTMAVGGDDRTPDERLISRGNNDRYEDNDEETDMVSFEEIYYWRHLYHADEHYYKAIQRMVFVNGIDTPVVDESWEGQQFHDELGQFVGATKFPIRVLTLTYLSDEAIPPSDSAVSRPNVNELIQSREDMRQQRKHSIPVRWFNTNRIDGPIQTSLMEGDWNGFIPTIGRGDDAIGEVARSTYPRENHEFDRIIRGDINEAVGTGPNQQGAPQRSGEHSASEVNLIQSGFQTRVGYERARVVKFFVGIADVMAGLIALYDDFDLPDISEEQSKRLETWDRTLISHHMALSLRADSTVLLDSNQRIDRLTRFLNMTGKSGFVNVMPVIEEITALTGLDPTNIVRAPEPSGPEPPNVSLRLSGAVDLRDPLALAFFVKTQQAPSPEELDAAQKIIAASGGPIDPALRRDVDPNYNVKGEPGGTVMEDDNPEWTTPPRVNTRRDGGSDAGLA